MRKEFITLAACFLFASPVLGKEDNCPTWPTYYTEQLCNCGEQLNNLEVTIPNGLKVMSACLSDPFSSPPKLIDLRNEKVSLDKYTNGNLPYGTIYLKGNVTINGKIYVERGPSSDYIFIPKWEFSKLSTAFGDQLSRFKFINDNLNIEFGVDEELLTKGCSFTDAKIQIRGIRVLIGETDEQGAYPVKTKVLHVGKYVPCS